jgi:hypothetical protein
LALPLLVGVLTLILLSVLPINASRRLIMRCLGPAGALRRELAPVFKPLFFQVKPLPCGAAEMVAGGLSGRLGAGRKRK